MKGEPAMLPAYHLSLTRTVPRLKRPVFLAFLMLLIAGVLIGGVVGPAPLTHASALAAKGGGGHNPPGPPPGHQPPGVPPTHAPKPTHEPPAPPPTHAPKPTHEPPGPPPTHQP